MRHRAGVRTSVVCREEEEAIPAIPRLRAVIAHEFENGIERHPSFVFGVAILRRQDDQSKSAIVGHVSVRRKNMRAVAERNIAR